MSSESGVKNTAPLKCALLDVFDCRVVNILYEKIEGDRFKTYFAAPNFDYTPDGFIQLGQITSSHKAPGKAICEPQKPLPKIYTSYLDDWEKEKTRTISGSVSVFAQCVGLLLGLGGDLSASLGRDSGTLLKFKKLETFAMNPSKDYIESSMRVHAVQDFLQDNPKTQSLFMITGIKVARGAECTKKKGRNGGLEGNIGFDLTSTAGAPVTLGPQFSIGGQSEDIETFGGSSDFIFAYRLCRIWVRRKDGVISSEDYTKGATYVTGRDTHEGGQAAEEYEKSEVDGGGARDHERCTEFEFGGEEEDFASAFVPPGFKVAIVDDEDEPPSRLLFLR